MCKIYNNLRSSRSDPKHVIVDFVVRAPDAEPLFI